MTTPSPDAWRFDGLTAVFITCALKRSPENPENR